MENTISGSDTKIGDILHVSAESIKKRGLVILISDFFDDVESIVSGIKHYRYKGNEVIVFYVLDPKELNLSFDERTEFIDLETGESITTDPWHIQNDYNKKMIGFCKTLELNCKKNKVDYTRITTETPVEVALFDYLLKRQKIN